MMYRAKYNWQIFIPSDKHLTGCDKYFPHLHE